jgi:L-cysteine/cystine lyase
MTDSEKIALIRNTMPVTREKVYFNTGSVGPLSTITTEALLQCQARELAEGRATMVSHKLLFETVGELRQAFANLVKADPEEIALTHHTTDGMNIVTHGLDWQPGDELVITDWEHPGGFMPPFVLRQRRGVVLKFVSLEATDSPEEIVAKFEAAITPRTRLMVFSHVAWNTGLRLPLAEVVAMGHRHQVLSLVDGAQSAGAIPLDLPASRVDFYALPGQKWLCGPEGTGALYVRPDRLSLLWPTFAGYLTVGSTGASDMTGYFVPAKGATRYEVGTINRPTAGAMAANLTWLAETAGWDWIYERIVHLAEYARNSLSRLPAGVTVITPPGPQAGLVTFNLEGYDPARVTTRLVEEGVILRFLQQPYALRISTGFYNTEADIDRLISALNSILAGDPDALPEFLPPW